jgi:amino acid transporter
MKIVERSAGTEASATPSPRKLTLLLLVAATYFMVAGGPYGLEDIVHMSGFVGAVLILVLVPLVWSVPTALMVSELSSAIPQEGGFYVWVRRGMGPFWGYQEVWLTLAGSIFEMALYPTLFVDYLGHFAPAWTAGPRGLWLGLGMIAVCILWNVAGAGAVGDGSVWMTVLLLAPFAVLTALGFRHWIFTPGGLAHHQAAVASAASPASISHADILGAILVAMWNYMGFDNASTVAGEVQNPQRTFPRAMLFSVLLIMMTYLLPVAGVSRAGVNPQAWSTGGWVDVGQQLGGEWLALAIAAGGVIGATGTFNALMLSFSRLPLVMARDGYLPKVFSRLHRRTGAPWLAIAACGVCWAGCLFLGFERLVVLDVLLTGSSILLEFWALAALRVREPDLHRPYRVPGGLAGAVLLGLPPLGLMIAAVVRNHGEKIGSLNGLSVGMALMALGPILYFFTRSRLRC